uniref:Suppressor of fused homolog n=1 Tax=Biomphalaria glabrata TaxID=6526 RepID=A0A2C9LFB6_BIOGL
MAHAGHTHVNDNTKNNHGHGSNFTSPKKFKIVSKDFGVQAIDRTLKRVYPEPLNPFSVSSPEKKIWNGGLLPLDYIKVFLNLGTPFYRIPHWHYVTYGLSDLHGDGRVHVFKGRDQPSGFGFELTFRLKKDSNENVPPSWPVTLLNDLSRYVFKTGIELCTFDYIPWFDALNKVGKERSRNPIITPCPSNSYINHMIVVNDPQLLSLDTASGTVNFLQIVGVLKEEFHYARSWKTSGIVDQLEIHPQSGNMLVTDISRKISVFDLNPRLVLEIFSKIESEGTFLNKVTCHVLWKEITDETDTVEGPENVSLNEQDEFRKMKCVHLDFDANAAELLPIMLWGRLRHGRNFVFNNPGCCEGLDCLTIEFIPYNVPPSPDVYVTANSPLKANMNKHHLQIFCGKAIIQKMEMAFSGMERLREQLESLPMRFMLKSAMFEITFRIQSVLRCRHNTSS